MKQSWILSDLHILGTDDPLYLSLVQKLKSIGSSDISLIFAGDIFDVMVGASEVFTHQYSAFFDELRRLTGLGVEIHVIEGNHDFHLKSWGRIFAEGGPGKLQVHANEFTFERGGKKLYIAHGDLVDRSQVSYLALRKFFRNRLLAALTSLRVTQEPIGKAWHWVGKRASGYSSGRRSTEMAGFEPDTLPQIRKKFRNFAALKILEGFDFVILGHCHDLDQMNFQVGGRKGEYWNVGFPRAHKTFVVFDETNGEVYRQPL